MRKNVQISYELFEKIVFYHLANEHEHEKDIIRGLEDKVGMMAKHDLYTRSKTALTEDERERCRKDYLDRAGLHPDFRW